MSYDRRYILQWLSGLLMLLLLTACSKSSDGDDGPSSNKPVLKIYVFPPDNPVITRGNNGDVNASEEERKINSLHIWVFEHHDAGDPEDGKYVGHISLNNVDIASAGSEVSMELSDAFASQETLPHVDVYVAANVSSANCGFSLSATTTRDQLDAALIEGRYFGVSNPIMTVPVDGLPMSGVLKDQQITGSSPTFQVSDGEGRLANARLVRAVSKIRFVFSKSTSNPDELAVNEIKLNGDVMPMQEFLFLDNAYDLETTQKWKVGSAYEQATQLVSSVEGKDINKNDSPASYSYDGKMSGQAYETLIQKGIDEGKLSDLGTFYLRESNKALSGTIKYTLKHTEGQKNGSEEPTVNSPRFTMASDGDFSRNHTWIVYAYFVSSGDLIMGIVEIKDWGNSENTSQSVYNW